MIKRFKKFSLSLLVLLLGPNAVLAGESYIGLNYDVIHYSELFVEKDSISTRGVGLSLGYIGDNRWGVEAKFGQGLGAEEAKFDGDLTRFSVDHYVSLLAVKKFGFTKRLNGYIKFGLTRAEITEQTKIGNNWTQTSESERSGSVGGSVMWAMDYELNNVSALNLELGMLSNRIAKNLFGLSVGVKTFF